MPAAAAPGKGGIQRGLPPPKLSLPPAPARPSGIFGAVAHAIQSTGRAASQAATYTSKPRTGPPGGGSDALSSGPGYGSARADAFKQTKAYHDAVASVFTHQSTAGRAAIVNGLIKKGAFKTPEGQAVYRAWHALPVDQAMELQHYLPHTSVNVGKIVDQGLAGAANLLGSLGKSQVNPELNVSMGGATPAGVSQVLTHAPIDVLRATLQDPSVVPKSIKGLGETALGSLAALVELPIKAVQEGPGSAVSQLASGVAHDYSQRYGPLASGNDQAFIDRIKKQGAGPELLDALGVAGGLDASLGRGLVGLAKTREALSGADAGFLTRERPALRVSGNATREQHLARGAMKITAQRAEDRLRLARAGKGEITPRTGEVTPLFGHRAQRIDVSAVAARTRRIAQEALNREVRHGAQKAVSRLSTWERKALPFAVEGTIPLRDGVKAAQEAIDRRMGQIVADRAGSKLSPGNRIAPQHAAQVDELKHLADLKAHASEWLTPRLAQTVEREGARAIRIDRASAEVGAIHPSTAEARRLRPQGEVLGIEHPDVAVAREIEQLHVREKELQQTIHTPKSLRELQNARASLGRVQRRIVSLQEDRHAMLHDYSQRVRKAAGDAKLPAEPGYLHHQPHPKIDFGAYTTGMGHTAMPGVKHSEFALFRGGALDRSSQAYLDGLAHSIKRPFQWRLVDEQFRRAGLPQPSHAAIRAALGHAKPVNDLTLHELKQALVHEGVDLKNVMFYRPGRLKESTLEHGGMEATTGGSRAGNAPPQLEASPSIANALSQEHIVQPGSANVEAFRNSVGWKALPRSAFEEIHSGLQPSGFAGRMVGKVQGLTALAILGGSPSFIVMNTLADVVQATAGTQGRLLTEAVKFPMWWHGLTDAERNLVRAHAGGRGEWRTEKLGSTAKSDFVRGWRDLQQRGLMRVVRNANPFRVLFKAQDLGSNFFRHVVFHSRLKHQALENIGRALGPAARAFETAHQAMSLKATAGVEEQMRAMLQSQPALEEAGRYTTSIMGDYVRFTSRERKWLNNRGILFYSFLRFATRTLMYTLPLHHPIITSLVGELGKLHDDEVRKLLGGVDLPFAYSRIFFNKDGKLTSVDLMRASPVGATITDVATQGIQGLSQTILPELQPLLEQIFGQTPSGAPVPRNVFSFVNAFLSMSYPYRAFTLQHFGLTPQQADSIPFVHERPDVKKTAAAQQYQAAKVAASGPLGQKFLAGLLGLYPKPDNSQVIAQHRAELAASKGGAGKSRYLLDSKSGSSGSRYLMNPSGSTGSSKYLMP